jgi:hypothetical protein
MTPAKIRGFGVEINGVLQNVSFESGAIISTCRPYAMIRISTIALPSMRKHTGLEAGSK